MQTHLAAPHTPAAAPAAPPTFVAIDFETADYGRDSACALALVRVEAGVIVQRAFSYIRAAHTRLPAGTAGVWRRPLGKWQLAAAGSALELAPN